MSGVYLFYLLAGAVAAGEGYGVAWILRVGESRHVFPGGGYWAWRQSSFGGISLSGSLSTRPVSASVLAATGAVEGSPLENGFRDSSCGILLGPAACLAIQSSNLIAGGFLQRVG